MLESSTPWLYLGLPLASAIAISLLPDRMARPLAMLAMLVVLALSLRIFHVYDAASDPALFDFNLPWMPSLGINLHLGVDGFNIYLLLLSALLSLRSLPSVLFGHESSPSFLMRSLKT